MKFTFEKTAGVPSSTFKKRRVTLDATMRQLKRIVDKCIQTEPESSILLPFLTESHKSILSLAKKYRTKKLRCVVVIGIGGSNLGTKAVYDAIRPFPTSTHECELIFLETVSSAAMLSTAARLKSLGDPEAFLIVVISKSGGTTETMANLETLLHLLVTPRLSRERVWVRGLIEKRCVIISDEGSKFWIAAQEKGIPCLAIPKTVGGRFSVFSAVGLFPLALIGIDVASLLDGARSAVDDGLSNNMKRNQALVSAIATHTHSTNGRTIHNAFFFAPELESLGKWYRQLMGESLGKEKDLDGRTVHAGITPIVSIGSTDLHSMAQLYFGGPDDKFTNIITVKTSSRLLDFSTSRLLFPNLVEHLASKTFDELMSAIVGGVIATYAKLKRPFIAIELERIDERELGSYLQFRMIEMMYLARLMNVNCFDQPNVEDYKIETKRLLRK